MDESHSSSRCDEPASNGSRNRPPSPPPLKSSKYSRSPSPRQRRPRTPPSREYGRGGGGGGFDNRFDRRRNYSPRNRRNRSRSPEFNRTGRDRRSRSTSRGRRGFSPRGGGRRRPHTPPAPPAMSHVPAYVPQPVFGVGDQYQGYCGYVPQTYNANSVPFDPNYMVPNNSYLGAPAPAYGGPSLPPPPDMNQQQGYIQQQQWGPPQQQPPLIEPVKPQDAAVALEMQQQKETLRKQRDDYDKRRLVLRRELKILKEQRVKLTSGSNEPPSPTTKNFLKENDRLQAQIENKMSTIDNVIEMLTNIIGVDDPPGVDPEEPPSEKGAGKRRKKEGGKKRRKRSDDENSEGESSNDDSEPEKLKTKVIESMKQRSKAKEGTAVPPEQVNYAFYDPELHWCKACNVFPKTAKDYLTHLHSKEHVDVVKKNTESPWHENNQNVGMPNYPNAPSRRTPIRGLQFFVPSTAWYCKLCSIWMGDLHCASLHLKSKCHSDSITKFVEHNPDFEVDWIRERQKAYDVQNVGAITAATTAPPAPLYEGIPLNLNMFGKARTASESTGKEPPKKETKKKKKGTSKKDKKGTKKKTKGGKSKRSGSSSSSSSSSSSNSDDSSSSSSSESDAVEAERMKVLLTLTKRQQLEQQPSIRNQMRKMEPERPAAAAHKNNNGNNERQAPREELPPLPFRSRRGDSEEQEERRRRRRTPEVERERSRSPAFDGRYRDRGRNRSRERQYRGRRDSRSKSPAYRRSRRTRSRSRSPRRIEKAVVNYPPQFKPRVAEKKATTERRRSPPQRKAATVAPSGKKLPFIGRMPVLKKQSAGSSEETTANKQDKREPEEKKKVETRGEEKPSEEEREKEQPQEQQQQQQQPEDVPVNDDDELMPDPEQLKRLIHDDQERTRQQEQEDMLPPGIDESESHLAPKAINDAPVPRRGPLPRDLEEALNIIFPDESQAEGQQPERKPFVVTGHIKDNGTEIITGPEPDDEVAKNTAVMYQVFSAAYQQQQQDQQQSDVQLELSTPQENDGGSLSAVAAGEIGGDAAAGVGSEEQRLVYEEQTEVAASNNEMDMDELAMLGIDANDLAAQCV